MLSVKKRQEYLKELGFYKGGIDGKVGGLTKRAYRELQEKYFIRKSDIDGLYGKNTDILLQCAYNMRGLKFFNMNEIKCHCGGKYCTGYPNIIDRNLMINIDTMREHYGVPFKVESPLRCSKYNAKVGGASGSRHKLGKALDISVAGYKALEGRKKLINYWINTYKESRYAYCNGYYKNKNGKSGIAKVPTMGSSVHVDVK